MTAAIFPTNHGSHGLGDFGSGLSAGLGAGFGPQLEVRFGSPRPCHSVYVRRRLAVSVVIAIVVMIGGLAAHAALADRGGVPASTSAIRSASAAAGDGAADAPSPAAAAPSSATYIVQSGDTLWSIAQRFHGSHGVSSYVDTLVSANHGTALQPGQLLTLP